ncbi:hypothetical protein [Vibrio phage VpKK5]|uniref:hypothetical protein n=1 Tax=Vibrio phage VpKK5 TaxID=1538804 RepID=UPI0004F785FE|nr:hypothetical protein VC55_gp12 [Vibrio phage VpKK5]AIM40596.1 hypothetical protein [Vibrio phage VpKK5]
MHKYIYPIALILATGCSSQIRVIDGDGEFLIEDTTLNGKGCVVHVEEGFTGAFSYKSETCDINIEQ